MKFHLGILALALALFTGLSDNQANSLRSQAHVQKVAQHENQPDTCTNMADSDHKCECHNAQEDCSANGGTRTRTTEDPKCQVYCRPDACKCVSNCDT